MLKAWISSNEWNGEECTGVVFYYALVFRRCHFSSYCYFTSRWVSCFCFICFLLVVSRIPARFLYFCRDCWWFFLKCHFCSHEVAVVSESHCHLRSFCSVLFVCGSGLMKFREWVYCGDCLMEASLGLSPTLRPARLLASREILIFKMFNCFF